MRPARQAQEVSVHDRHWSATREDSRDVLHGLNFQRDHLLLGVEDNVRRGDQVRQRQQRGIRLQRLRVEHVIAVVTMMLPRGVLSMKDVGFILRRRSALSIVRVSCLSAV